MEVVEHLDPPRLPAHGARRLRHRQAPARAGHHPQRRVQPALREPDRPAPPRPPLRVDPRASSATGRGRVAGRPRLPASTICPSATTTPRSARPPRWLFSPRRVRHDRDQRSGPCRWSCSSGCPAAASRPSPRKHFKPTAGPLQRLLPRPGRRRRERPVRPRRRRSTCCTTSSASGCGAAC